MILPIIMAGGSGTRLWPLSRKLYPKQFLPLTGKASMLSQTLSRLDALKAEAPIIVCNEEHRFIVAEELRINGHEQSMLILEPFARNTAPAIALAAIQATSGGEDPTLLVLSADHDIKNAENFCEKVQASVDLMSDELLVTFGIVPDAPKTGYGYIKKGNRLSNDLYDVNEFVEKPSAELASKYLESGEYLWNSGMFLFKASTYLQELKKFHPKIYSYCQKACDSAIKDGQFLRVEKESFSSCSDLSIDYAIMEHTEAAAVVTLDVGWNDIGGFKELWEVSTKDADGNVCLGAVDTIDTRNCYINSDDKFIATIGLEDIIIVDTKDALLVSHKENAQLIKEVVNKLRHDKKDIADVHREVYRPWGKYDSVDNGERFQVKRITVKPGAKLSVQMHHHRAEHWVVVSGTAKVTNGDKEILLRENESTFIPVGAIHALENPGKLPLELIEVQSGSYLGEDDIVRFEDRYGREND